MAEPAVLVLDDNEQPLPLPYQRGGRVYRAIFEGLDSPCADSEDDLELTHELAGRVACRVAEVLPDLAARLAAYLEIRGHTLSTAHLGGMAKLQAEAAYVAGEAQELRDAMDMLALGMAAGASPETLTMLWAKVRHEIADVALANTTLAGFLPGEVTVEGCIAEKTEADRGRG